MVWHWIGGIIYAAILAYAAVKDIQTHEVPDRAALLLLALSAAACVAGGVTWEKAGSMALGALAAGGPLLAAALASDGIGGGDVKLAAGAGVMLGWEYGLMALILSLIMFIIGALVCRAVRRQEHHAYAMAPSIAVGFTATYIFSFLMKIQ